MSFPACAGSSPGSSQMAGGSTPAGTPQSAPGPDARAIPERDAHRPADRHSACTLRAAELLKSRFFRRDAYPDRAAPSYWLIFSYPFWWTDLLSALDSLAQIGLRPGDPDIARGVAWFLDNQEPNGLWNTGRNRPKGPHADLWVGLAICRMLNAVSA